MLQGKTLLWGYFTWRDPSIALNWNLRGLSRRIKYPYRSWKDHEGSWGLSKGSFSVTSLTIHTAHAQKLEKNCSLYTFGTFRRMTRSLISCVTFIQLFNIHFFLFCYIWWIQRIQFHSYLLLNWKKNAWLAQLLQIFASVTGFWWYNTVFGYPWSV